MQNRLGLWQERLTKKCDMVDVIYLKKSVNDTAHQWLIEDLGVLVSMNFVFLTNRSSLLSTPSPPAPWPGKRFYTQISKSPYSPTLREIWTRQSHLTLYAKMPFALSLCRRCSYSFATSSGLSKDAAIVIPQYHRTAQKQRTHIYENICA